MLLYLFAIAFLSYHYSLVSLQHIMVFHHLTSTLMISCALRIQLDSSHLIMLDNAFILSAIIPHVASNMILHFNYSLVRYPWISDIETIYVSLSSSLSLFKFRSCRCISTSESVACPNTNGLIILDGYLHLSVACYYHI